MGRHREVAVGCASPGRVSQWRRYGTEGRYKAFDTHWRKLQCKRLRKTFGGRRVFGLLLESYRFGTLLERRHGAGGETGRRGTSCGRRPSRWWRPSSRGGGGRPAGLHINTARPNINVVRPNLAHRNFTVTRHNSNLAHESQLVHGATHHNFAPPGLHGRHAVNSSVKTNAASQFAHDHNRHGPNTAGTRKLKNN